MKPFDENLDVPPRREAISDVDVEKAVAFYRDRGWLKWDWLPIESTAQAHEDQRTVVAAADFDPVMAYQLYEGTSRVGKYDDGYFYMATWNPNGKWDYWRAVPLQILSDDRFGQSPSSSRADQCRHSPCGPAAIAAGVKLQRCRRMAGDTQRRWTWSVILVVAEDVRAREAVSSPVGDPSEIAQLRPGQTAP
jgi:hypothetical protein